MPRQPLGPRPLTAAERQARRREAHRRMKEALVFYAVARADELAADAGQRAKAALAPLSQPPGSTST